MNLNQYQQAAARTRNKKMTVRGHLSNDGLGLSGEAGEVAGTIKKILHHGHFYSIEKLAEELGDVLWYVADLCTTAGVSLESVALGNIAKLEQRYPDGFSAEASRNRDDGSERVNGPIEEVNRGQVLVMDDGPASQNEVANEHVIESGRHGGYREKPEGLTLAEYAEESGL